MVSILDTIDRPHRGAHSPRKRLDPRSRLGRNSRIDVNTGCLEWTGRLNNRGYAHYTVVQTGYRTVTLLAHRVAWEVTYGRIPEGLVIDHLCRNRACINVDHLELVTPRENTMRSPLAPAAVNARKTRCPQGHPYDAGNTYVLPGTTYRYCRACVRSSDRTTS